MKRFMSGFLLGAMLFGVVGAVAVSYVANPVDFKVLVNGKEFVSDPPALEVEGRTYLPLRAMGEALGVPVNWNEELRQAEVGVTVDIDADNVTNFIIGEVWNNGFWWIRNYVNGSHTSYIDTYLSTFADSADEEFDINKIVSRVLETKPIIEVYNNAFKGNEKWVAFYNEYNRLYEIVKSGTFTKENFNVEYFNKVSDEFCESIQ